MSAPSPPLTVDVVIPNHNYGRFLAAAIESACDQTHPAVNVIVVDDGSTDDSRDVLRGFEDRIEVVLQERGGQASALNAGIARCKGDALVVLDADDLLRPRAAELVAAAFAADEELAKAQFRMEVVDASGQPTGATKPGGHLRAPVGDLRRAELTFPFDLPWLPGGGTAFRLEAVRRILPIPSADYPRCGADWYLIHLTALLGTATMIDEVCASYRVHGDNGYELERKDLDLGHVRDSIVFAAATTRSLEALGDRLGLECRRPILSCADLANRLVSLRLDPGRHPMPGDRRGRLVADAMRAIGRRTDVGWSMKVILAAWFAVEAAAPRRLARPLAELFLFPERRSRLNGPLAKLQRRARRDGLPELD